MYSYFDFESDTAYKTPKAQSKFRGTGNRTAAL